MWSAHIPRKLLFTQNQIKLILSICSICSTHTLSLQQLYPHQLPKRCLEKFSDPNLTKTQKQWPGLTNHQWQANWTNNVHLAISPQPPPGAKSPLRHLERPRGAFPRFEAKPEEELLGNLILPVMIFWLSIKDGQSCQKLSRAANGLAMVMVMVSSHAQGESRWL